jgi:hypothetical protein
MRELRLVIEPDAEEPEAAEVYVNGSVGDRPYRFLLDTGAARTSLVVDDYTSSFESVEKSASSGVFASSSDDVITVPRLQVGPILRQNFAVVQAFETTPNMRNLIGMDVLKDHRCHFQFNDSRVLIDPDDEIDFPMHPLLMDKKFHPYVDVQFGGVTAKAVWDTGAGITIVDMNFLQRHPELFERAGESSGTDSKGATQVTPMFTVAEPMIGGVMFSRHRVAAVDLSQVNATLEIPMDFILGYSTLRQANWLFDFPRRQWGISKRLLPS